MKESPKPQLKFFYYKEASTFSWKKGKIKREKKKKENASLKLFPNLYKKEKKKIKDTFIKVSLTVRKSKTSAEIFFTTKRQVLLAGKKEKKEKENASLKLFPNLYKKK